MKTKIKTKNKHPLLYLIMAFFVFNTNPGVSQICDDWKKQTASYVIIGETPEDPDVYVWQQVNNISQGVHIYVHPKEKVPIYIQQNNNYINFSTRCGDTYAYEFMVNIEANIDNGGWFNVYNGSSKQDVVWYESADYFPDIGEYTLEVIIMVATGQEFYREYEIVVIPASDALYKDNYGNTLRLWQDDTPGNNKPLIFSEGFDAYNTNPQEMYYSAADDLIECLIDHDYDVYLLDNRLGTQDIGINAMVFTAATRFLATLYPNQLLVAGGVSMGGMISRYALAKAEEQNNPLPVHTYIAIDSPHQGAIISQPLQDYKKNHQQGNDYGNHALNNDAAKQQLWYNTFDPSGSVFDAFQQEINNLNGDGYPHLTRNIGVAFSTDQPNPNTGTWFEITWEFGPFQGQVESFDLTEDEKLPGSYFPIDLTTMAPVTLRYYWWLPAIYVYQILGDPVVYLTRIKDPTYISYESALDKVNGTSRFDVTLEPNQTTYHDVLPDELVEPIVNELLFTNMYLQNRTISEPIHMHGDEVQAGENVTSLLPSGQVNVAGNAQLTVDAKSEINLNEGFVAMNGAEVILNISEELSVSCNGSGQNFKEYEVISRYQDEKSLKNSYRPLLYPNPSDGVFYLDYVPYFASLEVSSQMGEVLLQLDKVKTDRCRIDLSDYPSGMYFLSVKLDNITYNYKLVKN